MLTTIQDLGRMGSQRLGIPASGAMDPFALRAANALVGNAEGAAALEITMIGPRVAFSDPCVIAITGADLAPRLDGHPIPNWESRVVKSGSVLEFEGRRSGARAYLAVSGGIAVEPWLDSRSTYTMAKLGGLEGRQLQAGDRLPVGPLKPSMEAAAGACIPFDRRPPYTDNPMIRVVWGPHADRFTEEGKKSFVTGSYEITQSSNRMGYRLAGPTSSRVAFPSGGYRCRASASRSS